MKKVEGNLSNIDEPQNLVCVCGNRVRMPENASSKASFCRCPKCETPFEFRDGIWLTAGQASSTIRVIEETTEIEHYIIDSTQQQDRSPSVVIHSLSPPNSPPPHSVDHPLLRQVPSELHDGCTNFTIPPTEINNRQTDKAGNEKASNQIQFAPMPNGNAMKLAHDLFMSESDTADNLQSASSVADINSSAIQPTTGEPHDCIRDSIRESLNLSNLYPKNVAVAISLACHPWPDTEISPDALKIIASELRPGLSLNHPSILEIACDRLLRLQEASQFEGYHELADFYGRAASCIISHIASVSLKQEVSGVSNGTHALINDPLGARVRKADDKLDSPPKPCTDNIELLRTTVISLLGAAIFRGSFDTGIAIGGVATGVTVNDLARHLNVELPHKTFDEWVDSLDERNRDILKARTQWLGPSDTLVEVAERWKITRERVRQIELKITEKLHRRFADTFKRFGKQMFSQLSHQIIQYDVLLGIAHRLAFGSHHSDILAGFLGELFGPWHKASGWIYHASLLDRVSKLRESLIGGSDDYGILDSEKVQVACDGLFSSDMLRDQFLIDAFGFGRFFDSWTIKSTLRCQIAAALVHIGQPATKEQIAELIKHPTQNIISILGSFDGIVRADRHRWGFKEWIADPYDGIFCEIEQRITESGGSLSVNTLLYEIPHRFNVSESSVRLYLSSAAFVVESGFIRLARVEDFVANSPDRCADAVKVGDKWGYRYTLQGRHFNGYSLGVNFDVAYANGLRPGDDLMVDIAGCDSKASIIWRLHSLNRLVDIGRLSTHLKKKCYKPGDVLVLVPSRETIRVISQQEMLLDITQQGTQDHNLITAKPQERINKISGKTVDQLLEMLGDHP